MRDNCRRRQCHVILRGPLRSILEGQDMFRSPFDKRQDKLRRRNLRAAWLIAQSTRQVDNLAGRDGLSIVAVAAHRLAEGTAPVWLLPQPPSGILRT